MTYYLGIDLGTTYTAAAVHDGSPRRGSEVVTLGERGPTIPSVLHLQADGGYVAGDAAERHAVTDPERIARQFKRRLGDPTPLLVGGTAVPAEVLTSQLLQWVVDSVVRSRGGARPGTIVLTHPANWGPYKRDLLAKAAQIAGLPGVVFVTEPQAAAIAYAAQERVDDGAVVAVYDLGGGTFDAAVLRKEADGGFTVLGSPEGIERLGGIDVDAALFAHVTGVVADAYERLDPDDPQALAAVARLRIECTQAKEGLSLDNEIQVPVLLPSIQTEIRLTRAELEEMIRPTLSETVTALQRALRSAAVTPAQVDHVLLVGGSSRIPLVAQLVSSGLGRPVAVDAHPKHAVALGAAIVAARAAGVLAPRGRPLPPPPTPARRVPAPSAAATASGAGMPPPPSSRPTPPASPPPPTAPPATPPTTLAAPPRPISPPPSPPPPTAARPTSPPPVPAARRPGDGPSVPAPGAGSMPPRGDRASAAMPPAPGTSGDLPPGFLTDDARAARRKRDRRRKRLGVAAGVLLLGGAVAATALITADSDETQTVADIEIGDCFNGGPNDIDAVACDESHRFELFALAPTGDPAGAFPGADKALQDGGNACVQALVDYYGATADVAAQNGLELTPIAPTEAQWNDGDTDTYCLATHAEGTALDASIKGQGAG